jgi:hypothetical protein
MTEDLSLDINFALLRLCAFALNPGFAGSYDT